MKETTVALLPADVLLEIFFHVKDDPAVLFRSATTCRQWLRLIVDPSFLRRCWPPQNARCCALVGFFTQEERPGPNGVATFKIPCFVPAPRSALASLGRRALASFVPSAPAGLFDRAVPVAARHGLLLMRLAPEDPNRAVVHLAVCDPLSGAYDLLPTVEWCSASTGYNGYAILTGADCRPRRPPMSCFKSTHVYHGAAHWRRGLSKIMDLNAETLSTIDMNVETGHLSRTELPIPRQNTTRRSYAKLCLSTAIIDDDEAPSLLWMRQGSLKVEIWERYGEEDGVDDDTLAWQCARVLEIKQPKDMTETQVNTLHMLAEKCGTLLVNADERFYVVDLKTGTMEQVRGWPRHWRKVVPFETDWPSIFIHQLGGR
uniref:F-box domain-containing protein n=1 Tax=Aegilops tauschii TaxID=37682 RepID=M8BNA5_AEGTA